MDSIRKSALINSLATAAYVIAIAIFMYWGGTVKIGRSNSFLIPISFLLLFVTSAAICAYLVFGKPAQMYLDGKKKEAFSLVTQTLIFLSAFTLVAICALILLGR